MKCIKRIKLHNFKRFQEFSVGFDDKLNLLIGDNEAGKSTILSAIDIVLSGSRSKVETIGLDSLFNKTVVSDYLNSDKQYRNLPILFVEVFLNEQNNPDLNGGYNSERVHTDGLMLVCEPNEDLSHEIIEILEQDEPNFPFEYYLINFKTFSGENYTGYRKFLKHLFIDNSQISNEYATSQYVKTMYNSEVENAEKNKHQNEYRKHKKSFKDNILSSLNDRIDDYSFSIKTNTKSNLENDLTITEDDIEIDCKGKGRQCFIKTEFALRRNESDLDIILLEEPENHLSHINMKRLIRRIAESNNKQLFIATHNNLISTRLDLRKSIMINNNCTTPVLLKDLTAGTAKFFIKAPDNNILEFILSKKVILVEGDAEYILLESFYRSVNHEKLEDSEIHIISVGGTCFKRYLEIARLLSIKTAVIRDNDKNYTQNVRDNYSEYITPNIKIFSDEDNERYTFEIALYQDNKELCDRIFGASRRTLSVLDFILLNKAEAAFHLLENGTDILMPPNYIKQALEWIKG